MEKSEDQKIGFGGNVNGTLKTLQKTPRMRRPRMAMISLSAPAQSWSPWVDVYAVIHMDKNSKSTIAVSLQTADAAPSSFDYEIKGGDHFIRGVAAGLGVTENVVVSGEVITSISVRLKGHSSSQHVMVRAN